MSEEKIDNLHHVSEKEYGDQYKAHYLEIYKIYVEMADRISARRERANSFFIALNTGILSISGYIGSYASNLMLVIGAVSIVGFAACYIWYRLILSYKGLNRGKYDVIGDMEKNLPVAPYGKEWDALGKGKDPELYKPFTDIEILVPRALRALYVVAFAISIAASLFQHFTL